MKKLRTFELIKKRLLNTIVVLFIILPLTVSTSLSQDEEEAEEVTAPAEIKLSYSQTDTTRICTALVMAGDAPVKETEVLFFVKRSFSNLPIESGETDENGEVSVEFPLDLPGDKDGILHVIAKIEDHEIYGTVEVQDKVKWGIHPSELHNEWSHRSLSASRDKAPMYLIIASNSIIALIWGTIFYVIIQVFRIKKAGKATNK